MHIGWIYKAKDTKKNQEVVIKVANRYLHRHSLGIVNNKYQTLKENILKEAMILRMLSRQQNAPKSVIKYQNLLIWYVDYTQLFIQMCTYRHVHVV